MLTIFPAVFESIWKRKETKIYLSFAFIFLAVYFVSTFIPNTKFLQFYSEDGSPAHFLMMVGMLYQINDTFPELALIFLTYTVFRKEVDDHVFFLYKDINRRQIILAKLLSLVVLIGIFFLLFFVTTLAIYYGRLVSLGFAGLQFFNPSELLYDLYGIAATLALSVIYVFITAFLSMHLKVGAVMVLGFSTSLFSILMSAIGSPLAYLFPSGFHGMSWEVAKQPLAYACGIGLTLFYALIFGYLTIRKFKTIEF